MKLVLLVPLLLSFAVANHNPTEPYANSQCAVDCGAYLCPNPFTCCNCFEYSRVAPWDVTPMNALKLCLLDRCNATEIQNYTQYLADDIGYHESEYHRNGCEAECGHLDYDPDMNFIENGRRKAEEKRKKDVMLGISIMIPVVVILIGLVLVYRFWYRPRAQLKKKRRDAEIAASGAKEDEWVASHDPTTGAKMIPLT